MNKEGIEIITYKGGNGSTVSDAIEIVGAQSFSSGVKAVFNYFGHVCNYIDITFVETEVITFWDKTIHRINVHTKKGWSENYFFNATNFQGKIADDDGYVVKFLFGCSN